MGVSGGGVRSATNWGAEVLSVPAPARVATLSEPSAGLATVASDFGFTAISGMRSVLAGAGALRNQLKSNFSGDDFCELVNDGLFSDSASNSRCCGFEVVGARLLATSRHTCC
jgi:hypothetical protein